MADPEGNEFCIGPEDLKFDVSGRNGLPPRSRPLISERTRAFAGLGLIRFDGQVGCVDHAA